MFFMQKDKVTIKYKNTKLSTPYFFKKGTDPNSATIIYFHGLGCQKEDFINIAHNSQLKSFSHFAFDFPGSGRAPYPKNAYLDFYDLVEITHKVLKKLKIKKLILVGHSSGGIVAVLYADKHPEMVEKLINIEGTLLPEKNWYSEKIKKSGFNFDLFKSEILPKMMEEIETAANKYPGHRKYLESLKYISLPSFFHYRVSHAKVSNELSLMKLYLGLSMSTLFVSGSKHFAFRPVLKYLKKNGAKVVVISKSHHFSFHENLKEFCGQIEKFLKER